MKTLRVSNSLIIYLLRFLIRFNILILALRENRRLLPAIRSLKELMHIRDTAKGRRKINRLLLNRGRFYQTINIPGWPSRSFNRFVMNELRGERAPGVKQSSLQTAFFEVTKKCKLKCEHCSFSGEHNTRVSYNSEQFSVIIKKLYQYGLRHIQFTGGEPLEEFDDLVKCIQAASGMDTWLLTSGYELSNSKANILKEAGLTGVAISLDHWDEEMHNKIRGNDKSFYWVEKAVSNCLEAGIIVGVSLCATREFTSITNLDRYFNLIKSWDVHFMRILEAKTSGRFSGKDIRLPDNQLDTLEEFFLTYNLPKSGEKLPIISYSDLLNREVCSGKGKRYIYVDGAGGVHPCPFSLNGNKNILTHSLDEIFKALENTECINCNLASNLNIHHSVRQDKIQVEVPDDCLSSI